MHVIIGLLCVLAGIAWAVLSWSAWRAARRIPSLPPRPDDAQPSRVRVVIAARDEAEHIAGSIQRLLQQQHVDLEIVLVDDRSTDGTSRRALESAHADPRLRVLRVDTLPEGWLGKCHALHVGGAALDRDWIAFVDADSWLAPDALARAVAFAQREQSHLLCLVPGLGPTTLPGRAALTLFMMAFFPSAQRMNRDAPRAYVGVGAFNLLSRAAHETLDPHRRLRLEVLDDIYLGRLVRAHGGRARCALALDALEVHWVRSARSLVRLLEKNQFAALGYSTLHAAAALTFLTATWCAGALGWLRGDLAGILPTAVMLASVPAAHAIARRYAWGWATAGCAMLIAPWLSGWSILHSVARTLARGSVRWRDTTYSLDALRTAREQLVADLCRAPADALSLPPGPQRLPSGCNHRPATSVEPMLTPERIQDGAS